MKHNRTAAYASWQTMNDTHALTGAGLSAAGGRWQLFGGHSHFPPGSRFVLIGWPGRVCAVASRRHRLDNVECVVDKNQQTRE